MANVKENFNKILDKCTELYDKGGASAVIEHILIKQQTSNPMYDNVTYRYCKACEAGQPNLMDTCLVCGSSTIDDDEDDKKPTQFFVDIPQVVWNLLLYQTNRLQEFDSRDAAIAYAIKYFNADENGCVSLVSQS